MKYSVATFIALFFTLFSYAETDTLLTAKTIFVTDKTKYISGNKHNYESLAYYYWPDPNNPNGKYICKDGQPSPEYKFYDGQRLLDFKKRVITLHNSYLATKQTSYETKCAELINAWFLASRTKMLPNFNYGQFIPGYRDCMGNPGSISEAYHFVDIINCIDQLQSEGFLTKTQYKNLKKWFSRFGTWMQTSELGIEMHDATDNLGIMYDILLYRIGMFANDKNICLKVENNFASLRLDKHIADDGSQPLELKRSNAYSYSIYNLQHIIDFCELSETNGIHYYAQHRRKIDLAMNYLLQFVGHHDKFPYQEIGNWKYLESQLETLKQRVKQLQ